MPSTSGHAGDAAANSQTGGHIPSPLQPQPAGSPSPEPPRLRLETSDIPSWGPEGIARPGVKAGPGGPSAELGAGAKRGPAHRQRDWSASPFGKGSIHRSGDQAAPCSQAGGCSGDAPFHLSGTLAHPPASWTPAAGHSEAAGEELCQGAVSARALPSPPPCSSVGTGREAEAIFRRKTNLSLPSRQQGRTPSSLRRRGLQSPVSDYKLEAEGAAAGKEGAGRREGGRGRARRGSSALQRPVPGAHGTLRLNTRAHTPRWLSLTAGVLLAPLWSQPGEKQVNPRSGPPARWGLPLHGIRAPHRPFCWAGDTCHRRPTCVGSRGENPPVLSPRELLPAPLPGIRRPCRGLCPPVWPPAPRAPG